jgi:serine/threonine protein phosphatase PrpC
VPARAGYPERTLRQDELRAERPPADDDDIFGDLYLDFEDAPSREPVTRIEPVFEPRAEPAGVPEAEFEAEPEPEPESEPEPEPAFDDEPPAEPAAEFDREFGAPLGTEFDADFDLAPAGDPDRGSAAEVASESEAQSRSAPRQRTAVDAESDAEPESVSDPRAPWEQAPRPAETFVTTSGPVPPRPEPAPLTVTPPKVRPSATIPAPPPAVPAPPTIAPSTADTTIPAAYAVPAQPLVPPMPTSPPRTPQGTLPLPDPAEDDAAELDVPTTSRSDSLRRAEAADDADDEETEGPLLSVQASAWSTSSHPGRRRAARRERRGLGPELTAGDNDDRYAATGEVFVVADGLGGHPAGWYAADVAVRSLVSQLASADLAAGWSKRLDAAIAVADLAVRRHAVAQYEGMRTTVVAAVFQHGKLHLAGCGDSVCWLVRGGRAFRLTEQGNAAEFGRPWLLTSTPLGGSQAPEPELQRIELRPGDRVVLATDGVGHLPDETVADLVHGDPFHAATTLTRTAVESGDDDATAVVVECDALPVPEWHRPAADPREQPEDASTGPGALRSDGGTAW